MICLRKLISLVRVPSTERLKTNPQETWLANGAEKMSELNEEDLERKSQFEIPFEKNDSSLDTNIAILVSADESLFTTNRLKTKKQETELASANVQRLLQKYRIWK